MCMSYISLSTGEVGKASWAHGIPLFPPLLRSERSPCGCVVSTDVQHPRDTATKTADLAGAATGASFVLFEGIAFAG